MNNRDIEVNLIKKFGQDRIVFFAEMIAYMYSLLENDAKERGLDDEAFDYGYDSRWWYDRYLEYSF